jgi:hypothetical protein
MQNKYNATLTKPNFKRDNLFRNHLISCFEKEYLAFSYSNMSPKLTVCLFVCLFVCLSVCLSVCGAVTTAVCNRDNVVLNDKLSILMNKEVKGVTAPTILSSFE